MFGSKNLANVPTSFQAGWLAVNFPPSTVPTGKHQLVGGASTVFNTARAGTTVGADVDDVQRPAGDRLLGDHVRERHDAQRAGGLIQSQYGGAFNHKQTRSIQ